MKVAILIPVLIMLAMACILLVGCASKPADPIIETKPVDVAVSLPCKPTIATPRPNLMTKEQVKAATTAAPTFDDRIKIVAEQLANYMGWTSIIEGALKGCEGGTQAAPPK